MLISTNILKLLINTQLILHPEQYGGGNMGIPLAQDQLQDVAEISGVMDADMFGYMDESIASQCSQYLPSVGTVTCKDDIDAYRFVKSEVV